MSVTQGVPRDVLRAQARAVAARKKAHRERALNMGVDWRGWKVMPAAVRCVGDPPGVSRPSSQCERQPDGTWLHVLPTNHREDEAL